MFLILIYPFLTPYTSLPPAGGIPPFAAPPLKFIYKGYNTLNNSKTV
jgi:hypothetical protein